MTLREEIQRYITGLDHRCFTGSGSEMMSVQSVASSLGTFLYRTANADAELQRKARIGELVESVFNRRGSIHAAFDIPSNTIFAHTDAEGGLLEVEAYSLLDALEALRAKTEGK